MAAALSKPAPTQKQNLILREGSRMEYSKTRGIQAMGYANTHISQVQGKLGPILLLKESRMSCADPKAPAGEQKKTSWPEVVGKSIEEAKEIILKDMPEADIVVLPAGSPVTMDFRSNRVRIFVDTVATTPHIG
ncbi:putative proteinase inhibitor [Hordeum vulgare]|nr:putative proteinase inhibitor [Hordeum vulgare]